MIPKDDPFADLESDMWEAGLSVALEAGDDFNADTYGAIVFELAAFAFAEIAAAKFEAAGR